MRKIIEKFEAQQKYFASNATRTLKFRLSMLAKLRQMIKKNERKILEALYMDLRKPEHEAWVSEFAFTLEEIHLTKKKLSSWMKPKKASNTPLTLLPSKSYVHYEPLGVSLIISPWNYPFQLAMAPLIGAISAGNCAIIKPSELTNHTSKLMAKMISETFPPEYITVVEGEIPETSALLEQKFDHIFFTGSTPVGKIVMAAAAKNLTPVTLELGGKSPVIVGKEGNLDLAARRIVWGKFFNAGQTCVAPDYLYVHESVANRLFKKMEEVIIEQYGRDAQKSDSLARMVNLKNHQRVAKMIDHKNVFYGGRVDADDLYIEPTILQDVHWGDPVMQEEIFGPILPVLTFKKYKDMLAEINKRPKPLAAYLFSESKSEQKLFQEQLSFGGGCINDTLMHLTNPHIPFGGVGESGMGRYHGQDSFLAFSHQKSVLKRYKYMDLDARYAPYSIKKTKMLKRIIRV